MRRVVSVWLPAWPTERHRLRHGEPPAETPLVLVLHENRRLSVTAADSRALALGIQPGMPLSQAQALTPGLAVRNADPVTDKADLDRLAAWCLHYSPLVAPDPPNGLWLDISGCSHLHGGETQLLTDLCGRLEKGGITARAAVADTAGAAHALARYSGKQISVASPGGSASAIAHLPAAALRLDEKTTAVLHRLGIATIDQMLALPKASLGRRFGTDVLCRLEQAIGSKPEPIQPITPPQTISARVGFVEPLLTPEAFSLVMKQLVTKVCAKLARAGSGALELDLLSRSVDGSVQTIRVVAAQATRDACHIARLFSDKLEQFVPGLGIEEMRMVVTRASQLTCSQNAAPFPSAREEASSGVAPAALIDRLANRLGAARVYRTEPVESDVPERSVRRIAATSPPSGRNWPEKLPRPVRLISPPQPVEATALLPDRPPAVFTWRRKRFRVRHADGPERIRGEWWHRDAEMTAVRDYWRVEDESGRRFWLYRRGDGQDPETGDLRWFLHGIF